MDLTTSAPSCSRAAVHASIVLRSTIADDDRQETEQEPQDDSQAQEGPERPLPLPQAHSGAGDCDSVTSVSFSVHELTAPDTIYTLQIPVQCSETWIHVKTRIPIANDIEAYAVGTEGREAPAVHGGGLDHPNEAMHPGGGGTRSCCSTSSWDSSLKTGLASSQVPTQECNSVEAVEAVEARSASAPNPVVLLVN
ncbi:hypothetical protein AcW1_004059 [Taiwanofungus camphoratus]|nr:hypothetical protein AcV7_007775 [Antrodia cinnamomea]KAI0959143.1 hypothetical protein AcW1_004059 [Antrodia cinnamomea]